MIKTMIVDDNKIIREHFQEMVDWESKGFELVSVAGNGITAWQDFEAHHPELVITDVKMPGMNGLELAKKIKEVSPDVVIVFISNYGDFDYLKTAINLGAYDYIMKHETRGKGFDRKLEEIRDKIIDINKNKRHYLESILFLSLNSSDIKKMEQVFPHKYGLLLLEQTSLLPIFSKLTNTEMEEVDIEEVTNLVYGYSSQIISISRIEKYRYAVLLNAGADMNLVANDLCRLLYKKTKIKYYALILGANLSARECCNAYNNEKEYLYIKFFDHYKYVFSPVEYREAITCECELNTAEIIDSIVEKDTNKVCNLLDYYAQEMKNCYGFKELCELSSTLISFFIENDYINNQADFTVYEKDEMKFWTNSSEIMFWLKNKSIQYINAMESNPFSTYSEPVKNAIEYIQKHYPKNDLTVGEIADAIGVDIYHLNKTIKQETGITTVKWITNIRMEKAKQLLEKQEKISQVCKEIGYLNLSHFSNAFKKIYGETPINYRGRVNDENAKNKKGNH